jgi:hypothetical protein
MATWREIPDYPKYECSATGFVRNKRTRKILVPYQNAAGYLRVKLGGKNIFIHRLVWLTHIGPTPEVLEGTLVIDHVDNNRLNNRLDNLQLLTPSENIKKGIKDSRSHANRKRYSDNFKRHIQKLFDEGWSAKKVSEQYDISHQYACAVKASNKWADYLENKFNGN